MKKSIITLAIVGAFAASAFSQGFVYFTGGTANGTKISTNSAAGGVATGRTTGDNSYYFALFASSSATGVAGNSAAFTGTNGAYVFNNPTGWTLVGIAGTTTTLNGAGTFGAISQGTTSAGQGALNSDGSLTAVGIGAAPAAANFLAIGWSANIGSTLASVMAWYGADGKNSPIMGWIGQSRVGIGLALGDFGQNAISNAMGTGANSINAFTLGQVNPVPEPTTLALAALGSASLLLFRRKK